jgi:S1-C subfamily serine protease
LTWREVFDACAPAAVYFEGPTFDGDRGIGTGFHVGGGWILTAAHVIGDLREYEIWQEDRSAEDSEPHPISVTEELTDLEHDLALVRTDCGSPWLRIADPMSQRPGAQDDVLVLGYPPVAGMLTPELISDRGTIMAAPRNPDQYGIIPVLLSMAARAGFSGGPVILEEGLVCGIVSIARMRELSSGVEVLMSAVSHLHVWDLLLRAWAAETGEHAMWVRSMLEAGAQDYRDVLRIAPEQIAPE